VGDDVEEAQEPTVEAPAGGDDAGQEGVFDSSISGPVSVHLGASGALQDLAWLRVTKRPVSANIGQLGDRRRIHGWRSDKGGLHD